MVESTAVEKSAEFRLVPALRMPGEAEAYTARVGKRRAGRLARLQSGIGSNSYWNWSAKPRKGGALIGTSSSKADACARITEVATAPRPAKRMTEANSGALRKLHVLLLALEQTNPFAVGLDLSEVDWLAWVKRCREELFGAGAAE